MHIFKYIGEATFLVGTNTAICFNSGSLILDKNGQCEVTGALARELDGHSDFERVEPKVEPKPAPKVKPKPAPKVEPEVKAEPKVEAKPEPKAEPKVETKPKRTRAKAKTTTTRKKKG